MDKTNVEKVKFLDFDFRDLCPQNICIKYNNCFDCIYSTGNILASLHYTFIRKHVEEF